MIVKLLTEHHLKFLRRLQKLIRVYTCQNVKLLEISCSGSNVRKANVYMDNGDKIPSSDELLF